MRLREETNIFNPARKEKCNANCKGEENLEKSKESFWKYF
jgi:hypothetical protein